MPKLNINRIIQESINENVALKLLDEISVELSTLVKELDNDELLDDSNPNDVIKFVKSLNSFTINVIYAIKRCVNNNNLNESNGVFGFLKHLTTFLVRSSMLKSKTMKPMVLSLTRMKV